MRIFAKLSLLFLIFQGPVYANNRFCYNIFSADQRLLLRAQIRAQKSHDDAGQMYSKRRGLKYSYHLQNVDNIIVKYLRDKVSDHHLQLLRTAAWLHDILEDTPMTFKQLKEEFNFEIATLVYAVTKPNLNIEGQLKLKVSLNKIRNHRLGFMLKLADRIANLEEGAKGGALKEKYYKDYLYWQKHVPNKSPIEQLLFDKMERLLFAL